MTMYLILLIGSMVVSICEIVYVEFNSECGARINQALPEVHESIAVDVSPSKEVEVYEQMTECEGHDCGPELKEWFHRQMEKRPGCCQGALSL